MPIGLGIGLNISMRGGLGGGFSLTAPVLADGRIFQRSIGGTDGPVALSGTYAAGADAIEVKVLLDADDSTVVDWGTLDASLSGGTYSGTVTVPQGGPYYVQIRVANDPGNVLEGAGTFFVGIVLIGYGQSNWLQHLTASDSPPAANANTRYFDGSAWITVPAANGIREMLNFLETDTGVPCGLLSGGANGVPISYLVQDGDGDGEVFDWLSAKIAASGGAAEFIVFHQGEGDADGTATGIPTWDVVLDGLHGDIAALVGRTKAQIPLLVSSLATQDGSIGTDITWNAMNAKIIEAATDYAAIYYSHSNMDAVLSDGTHWTGASYGRSGRRYAQTIADLLGTETVSPPWFIISVAVTDATHTAVTIVHALGTDFTPTSSITGFEVSDDGSTWISATGARTDATTIALTHTSLDVNDDRIVRYQYGRSADVSAPVVDNHALASPLNFSAGQTLADLALPVMTSSITLDMDENETFVATLTASRPSTFAVGGTDAALLEIQNDDELHFVDAPDYEAPDDDDADNVYDITITPTAIDNSDVGAAQNVAVTVNDVSEGSPFDLSFLDKISVDTDQASAYTISAAAFGTADANRKIALAFVIPATALLTISSVTIGGVTAALVSGATVALNTTIACIYEAAVPTGTSGDIVINFTGGTAARLGAAWWRVISGSSSGGQGASDTTVTTVSTTVTIPTDGVGLYFAYQFNTGSFNAWTNLSVEDFDLSMESGSRACSGGRRTVAGSTSVAANFNTSSPVLVACAYGP